MLGIHKVPSCLVIFLLPLFTIFLQFRFKARQTLKRLFPRCKISKWVFLLLSIRCRVAFSLMVRRHHCRACGQVFCQQCSAKQSTLPKFGIEKEVRKKKIFQYWLSGIQYIVELEVIKKGHMQVCLLAQRLVIIHSSRYVWEYKAYCTTQEKGYSCQVVSR